MRRPKIPGIKPKVVSKIRRTRQEAYTSNWYAIRQAVKVRDNFKCRQCGLNCKADPSYLDVHHIIPISRGGKTVMSNLKCLCEKCHSKQPGHKHLR